ncbi:Zinc finger CCCH domain-containing protein [Quillaja saponaria]|uniref:Zinc finger CCCH domain-containing protein n=1 Tax=Quillaja saponaria TaxID=32244 RepID=A0AAD7M6A4_QUISA|nr:Zinc finger CCCH domain-containing protein [Quillaja saponaria]
MLKGVNLRGLYDFSDPTENFGLQNDTVYSSDEFRMFSFKIKRCPRNRSHDWTECPFAHRGEKAQRRDPRRIPYSAVACPAFRNGKCQKGEFCDFAHGVFEYWLHPSRYRTRACNAGKYCQRKVCFFAHTPEQLRSDTKCRCNFEYRPRNVIGQRATATSSPRVPVPVMAEKEEMGVEVSEFLKSLRRLKINDYEEDVISDSDLPHIGWITELVQ